MRLLDLTLPTPAENLALDEALLEAAEAGQSGEALRFWESAVPFVVLGYANHANAEADLPACKAAGIPVLRRASGGGTVLQGPGCLNYSLVLNCDRPGLHSIPAANRAVMETNRAALQSLLPGKVAVQGHTDLTFDGRKFSGNAQRRKRQHLLFHGTFLLHFDLALIDTALRMPTHQPTYRQSRAHRDFVCNVGLSGDVVRAAIASAWRASDGAGEPPVDAVARLVAEKYSLSEWNRKF